MPSRLSSRGRIDQLRAFLREALEPYLDAFTPPARTRTGKGRELSVAWQAVVSELVLVRDLAILRSGSRRSRPILAPESSKPSEVEPGFRVMFQAAMAREILDIHSVQPGESYDLGTVWDAYRAVLLFALQSTIFSDVTDAEREAALRRLAALFVRGWDTTSPRAHGEAQQGLLRLQKAYEIDRSVAKWTALTVGIDRALDRWHKPRRIRVGSYWIYEGGEVAKKGLNEIAVVEYLHYHVDDPLDPANGSLELVKPVQGFAVLLRHLRRQMLKESEAWLAQLGEGIRGDGAADAGLTDVPRDVEPNLVSIKEELVSEGLSGASPLPDDEPSAPAETDRYAALLEAADRSWSHHHREALESLRQQSRLQRLLELFVENAGEDVDEAEIKRRVAEEEDVTVNAIEQFFSRLRKRAEPKSS